MLNDLHFKNSNWVWIDCKYKYKPANSYIMFATGIEYLRNSKNSHDIRVNKIITPICLNFSIGKSYIVYGGFGMYGSFNLSQKKTGDIKPIPFQYGNYLNLGGQVKVNSRLHCNTEFKLLKDKIASFEYMTPASPGDGRQDEVLEYFTIQLGLTYIFLNK
ncbi:MAG: hypothetical protein HUU47_10735 [Bacteroidetes bacterium]|nr:hypothetical protein [Bacteroidota bacterium]